MKNTSKYWVKGNEFERLDGRMFVIVDVREASYKGILIIGRYIVTGEYGSYYTDKFKNEFNPTNRWYDVDVYFTDNNDSEGFTKKVNHILDNKPLIIDNNKSKVNALKKHLNTFINVSDDEFITHVQTVFDNNDRAMKEYIERKNKQPGKVFYMHNYEHLKDKSNKSKGWNRSIIRK